MECGDIRKKFSDYMEGTVSPAEKSVIDEHLKSCRGCSEYLSDLRTTLVQVKKLEDVESPQWLTQKIMTKVKAEEKPRKGILGRLFYPLHVKLPLEVAATVVIAVTALYIFKTMQPEVNPDTYRFAKAPTERTEPGISIQKKEVKKKEGVAARQEVTGQSRHLAGDAGKRKDEIVEPMVRDERKSWVATAPAPESKPLFKAERLSREPAGEAEKFAEAPNAPAPAEKRAMMKASGAVPEGKAENRILSDNVAGQSAGKEEIKSITLYNNIKDFENTEKYISQDIMRLGGKIIRTETSDGSRIIFAQLSHEKLGELIGKLRLIGEVKKDGLSLEGLEGDVVVRIEIVGVK